MTTLRTRATLVSALVLTSSAVLAAPATSDSDRRTRSHHPPPSAESAQVVLDWERISLATVFPVTPIPSGQPLLGYTSLAMHDAAHASARRWSSSETAAVATAAHDVLVHYFPTAEATLDAHLTTTLAGVPDGRAEDTGTRIGARAAARMIESREDDGYGDPSIHYTLPPGVGTWQPVPPATDMLAPWLGSLRPLLLKRPVRVDGPDALTSSDYTTDFTEVKLLGSTASTHRTPYQTETAQFFNTNPAIMLGDALIRHLEAAPESLEDTVALFAGIHVAVADSAIRCWQLKRDVGFWRPFEAVARAAEDGNPDTTPASGWTSLLPTPPYSDYVSGHGCFTGPTIAVIRATLGDDLPLELRSISLPGAVRTYSTLTDIEFDAFHSRIWGGLHFRDAMADGYRIGRETARKVMAELHHRE